MIQLVHLTKTYPSRGGTVTALRDINLTVADGDIYGIIGLSGAGKSTLVRCINLLEKPTEGSVLIDGEDLTKVSPKRLNEIRRNVGMIFQSFNLLEQRTVFENVRFPLEIAKVKREQAAARVGELLELVNLTDKAKAYPSQLSGGQKQRVAIARALATNPNYLLCDEATSALDPNTTLSILELLKKINRELGVTVVVITHEMKVIESICNVVSVIDNSSIVESGAVTQVFSDPQSQIARELIIPNLIKTLKEADGQKKLRLIFDGVVADTPVISAIALDLGVAVNILYADTRQIDGRTFGQMVISLPQEEPAIVTRTGQGAFEKQEGALERLKKYLTEKNVRFKEEV